MANGLRAHEMGTRGPGTSLQQRGPAKSVPTWRKVKCTFLAKWHGPYEVVERVGPVNYKIRQLGCCRIHQIYHVNLLKKWYEPERCLILSSQVLSHGPVEVEMGAQMTPTQKQDLRELVSQHSEVFSLLPGRTIVVHHDIVTEPGRKVRLMPYHIPEAQPEAICEELRKMLDLNIIEESNSAWSSPIVLVPKPDGSLRFCNNFRKLNEISRFDVYPMSSSSALGQHASYPLWT